MCARINRNVRKQKLWPPRRQPPLCAFRYKLAAFFTRAPKSDLLHNSGRPSFSAHFREGFSIKLARRKSYDHFISVAAWKIERVESGQ